MDLGACLLPCVYPPLCLHLFVNSRAACGLSDPFSSECEKGTKNQEHATFLKKIHFFLILISEFQWRLTD